MSRQTLCLSIIISLPVTTRCSAAASAGGHAGLGLLADDGEQLIRLSSSVELVGHLVELDPPVRLEPAVFPTGFCWSMPVGILTMNFSQSSE